MKCPNCRHEIVEAGEFCGYCGHKYSDDFRERIAGYLELRGELENLRDIASNKLGAGIERLAAKVEKYYNAETARPAPPPPPPAPAKERPFPEHTAYAEAAQEPPPPPVLSAQDLAAGRPPLDFLLDDDKAGTQSPPPPPAPAPGPWGGTVEESVSFEAAMGQKWLLIIGVVATVFGIGYFLKYSFDQGWVGPAGRVAMAYLWGAAFLFGGNLFRRRAMENFGLYLSGGGIASLYFATFAAFQIYHLVGQAPAFLLMVMVTALAGTLAVFYEAKWLAVLGLIGGFLTPVLLGTGQDNQIVLMSYMTILNLGLLGVAFHKKWNLLTVLGFFFTYFLYTGWYAKFYTPAKFWPAVIFVNIFYLIYTVMPFITRFLRERVESDGFAVIIPNSFIAFGYSYFMVKQHFSTEAVGVLSVLYAAVFLAMASHVFRAGKQATEGFVVLVAKAMLFLVITVPLVFTKHWITIFWAGEAAALMWMGARLGNRQLANCSVGLFLITALKLALYDYPAVFGLTESIRIAPSFGHMLVERWVTAAIFFILLFASAGTAREKGLAAARYGENLHPFLYAMFGVLLFLFFNVETSAFFFDKLPQAKFAAISVLWTVFSVGLVVLGFRLRQAQLRKTALVLFMLTVLKVFLFDMSNFSTPYRIISFIILGLLLVSTSFLYHKYKHKLEPEPAGAEEKA